MVDSEAIILIQNLGRQSNMSTKVTALTFDLLSIPVLIFGIWLVYTGRLATWAFLFVYLTQLHLRIHLIPPPKDLSKNPPENPAS